MSRRKSKNADEDDGFAEWGGYMAAKVAKLQDQFNKDTTKQVTKLSDIFSGVAIFINGRTNPTEDELKQLMAAHGGQYHAYQTSRTTHIIASNLPNVKIKQLGNVPIVKPDWITDSINANKLLDYRKYLLYTNQSRTQPKLDFSKIGTENAVNLRQSSGMHLTASDPRFLEEFYNNSRLHLISTLGAEFKQLVRQFREKSTGHFPGKVKLLEKYGKESQTFLEQVIMHIDMDCFFVSVGLRKRPDLRDKPVAVTHAKSAQGSDHRIGVDRAAEKALYAERLPEGYISKAVNVDDNCSMSEIASCSYEARKLGVKNGMFLGAALKLCPELQTIPYDFQDYREVSHILYNTVASYTLDIEAVSCDEMYVDVTKVLQETGLTVYEWASHLRNEIMEITKCPCSTGFGANRLQARLATRKAKPAGQFYLKSEDVEEYLAAIPLSDLPGVGIATVLKLKKLDLHTCGDVQNVPLNTLQAVLGPKAGETLRDQAFGIDKKPLNFDHERKSVSAEVNYGIRFKAQQEALDFIQSLSVEVCNRLTDVGMRARCLTLKLLVRAPEAPLETAKFLGHGVCDSINKSTTSGNIIAEAAAIFKEAKNLYERLNIPFYELRGVGIQLTKLEKIPPVNKALTNFLKQASSVSTDVQKKTNITQSKPKIVVKQTKGRGRGKGKSISRKPSNELQRYFKTVATTSTDTPKTALNRTNIDMEVLNELPEELRNEIIKEYNLEEKLTEEALKTEQIEKNTSNAPKSILHLLNREQLKDSIRQWLRTEPYPKDVDVKMLGDYFKELAIDRKIEQLHVLLNFLYRLLCKQCCGIWHKIYFDIVNVAQEGMVARYGNTLLINRRFPCCSN